MENPHLRTLILPPCAERSPARLLASPDLMAPATCAFMLAKSPSYLDFLEALS